jgi:hypothetical protein
VIETQIDHISFLAVPCQTSPRLFISILRPRFRWTKLRCRSVDPSRSYKARLVGVRGPVHTLSVCNHRFFSALPCALSESDRVHPVIPSSHVFASTATWPSSSSTLTRDPDRLTDCTLVIVEDSDCDSIGGELELLLPIRHYLVKFTFISPNPDNDNDNDNDRRILTRLVLTLLPRPQRA